jgi:hypothetical protein
MNRTIKILTLLLLISCQQNGLNEDRITKIGKELSQTEFTQTNYPEIKDVVMVGNGLREKMTELQKNATEFEFKITEGDLEKPFGDNQADAVLAIITDYKNIGIRIKYDKGKDKYHILGWMTLNNAIF